MTERSFQVTAAAIDLGKPENPKGLSTGIGFFDHMLDQFNSHAQIGVSVLVTGSSDDVSNKNRFAEFDQLEIATAVATELGKELGLILKKASEKGEFAGEKRKRNDESAASQVTFSCPLDEALVQ